MPLDILADEALTVDEKNEWWLNLVKAKLSRNEIRFYQESTYLFDE